MDGDVPGSDDDLVFHGTSTRHVRGILREGLRPDSSWGTEAMARYFAREECRLVGGRAVLFSRTLASLAAEAGLAVDEGAVDFPMSDNIGVPYDELYAEWEEIDGPGWRDCLRLFHAVRTSGRVLLRTEHQVGGHRQAGCGVLGRRLIA